MHAQSEDASLGVAAAAAVCNSAQSQSSMQMAALFVGAHLELHRPQNREPGDFMVAPPRASRPKQAKQAHQVPEIFFGKPYLN